jgi:RNA-directed DNA polymerase
MQFLYCCGVPVGLVFLVLAFFWLKGQYTRIFNRNLKHFIRTWRKKGHSVNELAVRLRISEEDLRATVPQYTERRIPKRSGATRTLHVPSPALKAVQRKILRLLLARLKCHPAAHGFERGRSIVTNARIHAGRAVVIKADIRDFFNTTSAARVEAYFQRIGWNAEAASLLTKLVTYRGGLPQGAPTSPRLSNLLNIQLDTRLTRYALRRRGVYSRYADDMTFSFCNDYPTRNRGVVQAIRKRLKALGYEMHRNKTRILRPHQQKRVTGLVVNVWPALPRIVRRRLRAARHHLAVGRPATFTPAQIEGWSALENMIRVQTAPGPWQELPWQRK